MLCTNIVLNVKTKTKKQFLYTTCCELVFFLEFNEQSLIILWVNWFKNESFWHRFTCTVRFFKSGVVIGIELHEYSYCVLSAPPPPTPLKVINHNHLSNCFAVPRNYSLEKYLCPFPYLHSSHPFNQAINTNVCVNDTQNTRI